LIAALDGLFIGESLSGAQTLLGKPQPAVYRQLPAYQWKQPSGLVITVVAKGGSITLVNETAAPSDDPTGLAEEDSRISGLMFNKDTHASLALDAPANPCKATAGTECWEYQYDRGVVMRAQFTPDGQGDMVLRDVTLGNPPLLEQLHIYE
jgi:hypothetical protein